MLKKILTVCLTISIICLFACGKKSATINNEDYIINLSDIRTIRTENGDISFNTYNRDLFTFIYGNVTMQALYCEYGNIKELYNKDILPGIPSGKDNYKVPTKSSMKKIKNSGITLYYYYGDTNKELYVVREFGKVAKNKYGYDVFVCNSKTDIDIGFMDNIFYICKSIPRLKADKMKIDMFLIRMNERDKYVTIDAKGIYYNKQWAINKKGSMSEGSNFEVINGSNFMLKKMKNFEMGDMVTW